MSLKIRTELPRASRSRSPLEWKKHCLTVLKAIDLVFTQDDRRENAVPAVSNNHQPKEGTYKTHWNPTYCINCIMFEIKSICFLFVVMLI